METVLIIVLLTVIASLLTFIYYGHYKKDKKQPDGKLYIEGLRALLDNRDEEAFGKFREVVADDSNNIDAYLRLGDILTKYGKADKALQVHKDLTLRHNLTIDEKKAVLRALADDFMALDDADSAESALKELVSIDSSSRWGLEKLLKLYETSKNWDSAYTIKEKLIKIDGDHSKKGLAAYRFYQGEVLFDQKEYHKARVIFKEAIAMDQGYVPAYARIGDSYVLEDRLEDAVNIWRKLISGVPEKSGRVLGRLKKALFELGRYGDISTVCNDILEGAPDNCEARLLLADYHQKKGENSLAIEHLRSAVESHPESYTPALELAKLYLSTGSTKELSKLLDKLRERGELDNSGKSDDMVNMSSSGKDIYSGR